jgi:hypothetical protein
MAEKTVAEKARVKPGTTIALVHGVDEIVASLGLPTDVRFAGPAEADLIFLFVLERAGLDRDMRMAIEALRPDAALWVFFRKGSKAAGLDMNRDDVWAIAESLNMRPLGLLGVDDTWSVFRLRRGR